MIIKIDGVTVGGNKGRTLMLAFRGEDLFSGCASPGEKGGRKQSIQALIRRKLLDDDWKITPKGIRVAEQMPEQPERLRDENGKLIRGMRWLPERDNKQPWARVCGVSMTFWEAFTLRLAAMDQSLYKRSSKEDWPVRTETIERLQSMCLLDANRKITELGWSLNRAMPRSLRFKMRMDKLGRPPQ